MMTHRSGVAFAAVMLIAPALSAQIIQGRVVSASGDSPIPGVVVSLVDSGGATVARALSDGSGRYELNAPRAGAYRVRTQRIGFRPGTSESFTLAAGASVERKLELSAIPFSLDTVRVAQRNVCGSMGDSAAAIFAMWEQVRTALHAAQLTSRARGLNATVVSYERTLEPRSRRIAEQTVSVSTGFVTAPWRSPSIMSLRREGYVVQDAQGWTTYRVPGLDVLTSDAFVQDHCFQIVRPRDGRRLGLEFQPTRERREMAEIRGTIWLDRRSAELRGLEFGYVNLPAEQEGEAGGELAFARMKDGGWAIARWNVRMPVLEEYRVAGRAQLRVAELRVAGGDLSVAIRGTDTLWMRDPVVLSGTVEDSVGGTPVAQATVSLQGTHLVTRSASDGRFTLSGVLPGSYMLEVRTPALDSIATSVRRSIVVADQNDPVQLRIPTRDQVMAGLPPSERVAKLVGRVLGDSAPLADAEVSLTGLQRRITTGPDGAFTIDDLPPGQHGISVRKIGFSAIDTIIALGPRETAVRQFVLARATVLDTVRAHAIGVIPSFDQHRELGRGHFFTRDTLEKMTNRPLSAILSELPGARVVPIDGSGAILASRRRAMATFRRIDANDSRRVMEQGFCPAAIFINGAAAYRGEPGEPTFNINTFSPDAIEAIEYYASPASIPARYAGKNTECGVLVIHTRRAAR